MKHANSTKNSMKITETKKNNTVCRLCTKKGNQHKDLLDASHYKLQRIINKFFTIFVSNKDECHHLCPRCDEKLNEWNQFYEEIEEVQKYFRFSQTTEKFLLTEGVPNEINIKLEPDLELKSELLDDQPLPEIKKRNKVESEPAEIKSDREDITDSSDNEHLLPDETTFHSKTTLSYKDRDRTINEFFNFTCPNCSHASLSWQTYKQHLTRKHKIIQASIICCELELPLERRPLLIHVQYHMNPEKLQCRWCNKQFINDSSKRKHEWRHKAAREGTLQKKNESQKVACSECGKVLVDKFSYRKHMQLHMSTEEREKSKVQCDLCKKLFRDKSNLVTHFKNMHMPKEELFSCDQCARVFTNKGTFFSHYKNVHATENKVICPDCGIEIKSVSLRRHKEMKHDHQAQTCPLCSKEFKNRLSLKIHQQRVHIEARYSCDVCGKMFKVKDKWKEHRDAHFTANRFSCDQCDYINNNYANMLKHRKTKHPEAPPLLFGMGRKLFEVR